MKIQEISVGLRQTANNIKLIQFDYALGSNEGCKVKVQYFNDDNLKIEELLELPSEIVAEWTDDQPLIDYVLNELGLIVKPNVDLF
jgi:hypothetical protein